MKQSRNALLVFLNTMFKNTSFVHFLGFISYQFLFSTMSFYFRKKFPKIVNISKRHSLKNLEHFNLFFSDIDSTFVVEENDDQLSKIIVHFYLFKKLFPMFDMPEFYTPAEYNILEKILSPECEPYLNVAWHLRKLNWIKKNKNTDRYEKLKMQRAFARSFSIVFSCEQKAEKDAVYSIGEINYFKDMLSGFKKRQVCIYSFFLGTTSTEAIHLHSSADDFIKFNSLMAGEELEDFGSDILNTKARKIKYAIEAREQLIANNSLRVAVALGADQTEYIKWKTFLDERNAIGKLEF
jgi:hypothetical protein